MSGIFVHGCGAVSPAGWSVAALRDALAKNTPIPTKALARPGWDSPIPVRQVPPPEPRPAFLSQARLRRASPISHYLVASGLEALGEDATLLAGGKFRLGVVVCVMSGCVNYSRRFFDETLRDPATASPLVFPETVFNAPASHIAALLGTPAMNYTLVGDSGAYLQGIALAAQWLLADKVDGCLVAGGEESDWLTANAFRLFSRNIVLGDGAGALYLKRDDEGSAFAELRAITDSHVYGRRLDRLEAARRLRADLPASAPDHLLVDGFQRVPRFDAMESVAWKDWTGARLSPKCIFGEGLMAAPAWQCVAAVDLLRQGRFAAASVSVTGCNQQAIGVHFVKK